MSKAKKGGQCSKRQLAGWRVTLSEPGRKRVAPRGPHSRSEEMRF